MVLGDNLEELIGSRLTPVALTAQHNLYFLLKIASVIQVNRVISSLLVQGHQKRRLAKLQVQHRF